MNSPWECSVLHGRHISYPQYPFCCPRVPFEMVFDDFGLWFQTSMEGTLATPDTPFAAQGCHQEWFSMILGCDFKQFWKAWRSIVLIFESWTAPWWPSCCMPSTLCHLGCLFGHSRVQFSLIFNDAGDTLVLGEMFQSRLFQCGLHFRRVLYVCYTHFASSTFVWCWMIFMDFRTPISCNKNKFNVTPLQTPRKRTFQRRMDCS